MDERLESLGLHTSVSVSSLIYSSDCLPILRVSLQTLKLSSSPTPSCLLLQIHLLHITAITTSHIIASLSHCLEVSSLLFKEATHFSSILLVFLTKVVNFSFFTQNSFENHYLKWFKVKAFAFKLCEFSIKILPVNLPICKCKYVPGHRNGSFHLKHMEVATSFENVQYLLLVHD